MEYVKGLYEINNPNVTEPRGHGRSFGKEFIAIVVLVSYMVPEASAKASGRTFLELFSGRARTSRMAQRCGYLTSAIDINYSEAFNLLKPAGFVLLN